MTVTELPTVQDGIRQRLEVTRPEEFDYINLFLYGTSGVGKTYYLGTAEECDATFPFLVVDCEGGSKTLRPRKNIDVRHARTVMDIKKIHDDLLFHNHGWYAGVGLDNISEVQDVDIRHIMVEAKETARNPDNIDIDVPSPREYGKSRTHMRQIVRAFRDLPMHTFVVALDQEVREGDDKPIRYRPNVTGKLQVEIPAFMDIVGYYYKDANNRRIMQFAGSRRVIAKTRFPELGDQMFDPTIPKIWDILSGKGDTS